MSYRITYHVEVGDEVFEAWEWYESKKKGFGDAFMDEFEKFLELIGENPFLFQKLDNRIRRCPMSRFPYLIVYLVQDDSIFIISVMHTSRKPGYWKNRLK